MKKDYAAELAELEAKLNASDAKAQRWMKDKTVREPVKALICHVCRHIGANVIAIPC